MHRGLQGWSADTEGSYISTRVAHRFVDFALVFFSSFSFAIRPVTIFVGLASSFSTPNSRLTLTATPSRAEFHIPDLWAWSTLLSNLIDICLVSDPGVTLVRRLK